MKINIYKSEILKFYFFAVFIFITAFSRSLWGQIATGDPNAVPVEFRFPHMLAPTDSGVGLNGNINDWGAIFKMKLAEPNVWKLTMDLLPKSYEYKFVTYTDTASQSGVTGYFTDPLNARFGGPFNNSFLDVTNPMVYYFLPKDGSTTANLKPQFSANFAVANGSQLDMDKIEFTIDGLTVPDAKNYYDAAKKLFTYNPTVAFEPGDHNATIKIYNKAGTSAEMTTVFTIASGIITGNHTFIFDSKSPNFNFLSDVKKVDLKGTFNSEGLDVMKDSNGVYTVTRELNLNKPEEYTYIINGGSYINDPDNPLLSAKHRTQIIKKLNPRAEFKNFSPESGISYTTPLTSFNKEIKSIIVPSDSAYPLISSNIFVRYDGVIVRPTRTPSGNGFALSLMISNPTPGRHVLEYNGKDDHGNNATIYNYVFGYYPPNSGFHYVDNENDDKGTGSYTYPSGVPSGSADIREVNITASPNLDSLNFNIKLETVSPYTRLGFSIVNDLNGTYTEAMQNVELKIPEWNNKGVFIILSDPSSPYYDSTYENILFTSRDPLETRDRIKVSAAATASGEINFSIPLSVLQTYLGNYNTSWYYGMYSYLKNQEGTIEINPALGINEDPDVFDCLFFADQKFQERLLSNYSTSSDIGGPRIATIGKDQRGYGAVLPSQIHPSLGLAPEVKIYGGGGDLYNPTVVVKGFADVGSGSMIEIRNNLTGYTTPVNSQKEFQFTLPLTEGINEIKAGAFYDVNKISYSKTIIYNYIVNHKPVAKIRSLLSNTVILSADSSYDPDGTALIYEWTQDAGNPQQVIFDNKNNISISFPPPTKHGEYYFRVKITDAANDTAWARAAIVVNDSVYSPDKSVWHPAWVDTSVFYCVFVRTFDASGTFNGLASRMQEIKDLGASAIWLLPIHPSTGNMGPDNPGYAITNYLDVLKDYGTKADFKNLVNTAHQYGIRVILDHVIQHTSDLHPFMKDANEFKQASPYYPFYTWDSNNNFRYLFTWVDLPSINYENEDTRNYLVNMAKYWVQEFNVDGYRCDVAWAVDSLRASGPAFWQRWRSELKSMKPDVFLLAEGDAWQMNLFNKKFDAAYDWKWFGSIKGVVSGTQTIENLNNWIKSYYSPGYPKNALTFKFMENQDEQRFIEAFGIGETKLVAAHLLTAPGIPMLYAGQEVGEKTNRGNINWSDPSNLRPFYKKLISIRKENTAFTSGDFTRVTNNAADKVYSYLRTNDSSNAVVNLNFSSTAVTTNITVPLSKLAFDSTSTYYLNDLLNGTSTQVSGTALRNYQVTIQSNTAQVFVLSYDPITDVKDENELVPVSFSLLQNYPNPFNPSTTIKYSLPSASKVTISVYNILGQRVDELINREQTAGNYDVVWNAGNYASGVYIYSIETSPLQGGNSFRMAKKMILMK